MSKQPTKADLIAIINNLEAKIAQLSTAPAVVPPAGDSIDEIEHMFEDEHEDCPACAGTGEHSSGGMCYKCKGKGYQDEDDKLRNAAYQRVRTERRIIAGTTGYARATDCPAELRRGMRFVKIDGLFYPRPA